jgi:pyruvate dehydrogenase E2 component (dihydrolipoamide acetyltransferase)
MRQPITMPALSDTMNKGRLAKWLKQPGDKVRSGEAIAEVETDKAIMEVEAFHDGYLAGPLADVDHDFPVGETIGYIAESAAEAAMPPSAISAASPKAAEAPIAAQTLVSATSESKEPASQTAAAPSHRASPRDDDRLSPRARALARHASHAPAHAEPVHEPQPSPSGEQSKPAPQEVAASQADLSAGPAYRVERASSLREAVALTMIAAAATPIFRVSAQFPLEGIISLAKEKGLSLTLLLARACARAVAAHPLFNSAYTPEGLARRDRVDIGIAVDGAEGLITPVLRDVANRPLSELAEDWLLLRDKVRTRRLQPSDYRGATFYLSDLGVFPVVYAFDAIIPVGASAILAVAASRKEGTFFTLSCDHRVIFGGDAARFLQTLSEWLATPARLMD